MTKNDNRPTLVILAGPNGAGKSTLYETRVAPVLNVPFINADNIQRDELNESNVEAAYKAARIAAERREQFLTERKSFATETVFSHPSKLDMITQASDLNYRIYLLHIGVSTPGLSVARVAERVKEGGHSVPEHKIVARYERNGPLICQAAMVCDVAHVYDNSTLNTPPTHILSFKNGKVRFSMPNLPDWAFHIYKNHLNY